MASAEQVGGHETTHGRPLSGWGEQVRRALPRMSGWRRMRDVNLRGEDDGFMMEDAAVPPHAPSWMVMLMLMAVDV